MRELYVEQYGRLALWGHCLMNSGLGCVSAPSDLSKGHLVMLTRQKVLTFKSTLSIPILLAGLIFFSLPARARGTSPFAQLKLSASASTCRQDTEISSTELAAIDDAAISFVRTAIGSDPDAAYRKLSDKAKASTSQKQFESYMRMAVDPFAPFAALAITHTYLANVLGTPQDNRVLCGALSKPEDWVSFKVEPSSRQAWVLIDGKARNNNWTFAAWLIPVGGTWQINSVNAGASTLANQSAADLWKTAEREHARQHSFNAFVLYNTVLQLSVRGPLFEYGIASAIRETLSNTPSPALFQGKPPFTWQLGHDQFQVINAGALAVAGKIYLDIAYLAKPWKNYDEVDREDRKLIESFASAIPEYSAVFAGIIAEAHEIGGTQGYRTVAVVHNGSLEILPPPGGER
ncbi:MAG TPA: hypothetical protein VFQ24_02555 [Terriglobia bacterium]|nr:hypothetical protein [Terriglobia bacterium]